MHDATAELVAVLRRTEHGDGPGLQNLPDGKARGRCVHAAAGDWNATSAI